MLELTLDNTLDYLRAQGWLGRGPARVELLGGGVSNLVLRVESAEGLFVLKQSRPRLRTRDLWISDIDRVYREQEVMQTLHPLLPALTVPQILFVDRPNYVFAMSHAPTESRVWKESLLAGQIDSSMGQLVGSILGRMHDATAANPSLVKPFSDHTVFVQLRVEPFYRRVQERRPEVAAAIQPIVERMLSMKAALCHGDYTPKNILTHDQGFTLVDYETAHYGDPSMDLGLCLCHLILKSFRSPAHRMAIFELTRVFWRAYQRELCSLPISELETHGIEHFGACLLARIDGTSPVDYLPDEPRREAVRRLARKVLWDRPERWEDAIHMAEIECAV
jgi:5-methylthioribose kinase